MMTLSRLAIFLFLYCLLFQSGSYASEISVPQDWPTIQEAINAAQPGDEIVVQPGVYPENIDFLGKAITVRSTDPNRPDVVNATVIEAYALDSVVKFTHGESRASMLIGLTITAGQADFGGGIFCSASSPTIAKNRITGNIAAHSGGGIWATPRDYGDNVESPLIVGNSISGNQAGDGGAISTVFRATVVTQNSIQDNHSTGRAAVSDSGDYQCEISYNTITGNSPFGVYCGYGTLVICNTIAGNGPWGGIHAWNHDIITDNTVSGNTGYGILSNASGNGVISRNIIVANTVSGIYTTRGDVVENNFIAGNLFAGAYWVHSSPSVLAGNLIVGNGVGIDFIDSRPLTIASNTVVSNKDYAIAGSGSSKIENCIIAGDTTSGKPLIGFRVYPTGGTLEISNCLVQGGQAVISVKDGTLVWDPSNIDADPLFVDTGYWDRAGYFVSGDYHLLPGSPCIDAGNNDVNIDNPDTPAVETLPDKDIAGNPRIIDGNLNGTASVDMGAYEYLPGDPNLDGLVNILDLIFIRNRLGKDTSSVPSARRADLNNDGRVDVLDLMFARDRMRSR